MPMKNPKIISLIIIAFFLLSAFTFAMPTKAQALTQVVVTAQTGGYVYWNDYAQPFPSQGGAGTQNFQQGQTIVFTETPNNNYRFAGWDILVNGVVVASSNSYPTVSFPITTQAFTIRADFTPSSIPTFTITDTGDGNTWVTPVSPVIANRGDGATIYYSAFVGYQINQVLVDGQSVPITGSYTFTNIQSNHGIYISSIPIPAASLLITFTNTTGGSIGWSD